MLFTNDYTSASPIVYFNTYVISVSSNRVHVYKICKRDGPTIQISCRISQSQSVRRTRASCLRWQLVDVFIIVRVK